MNIYVGNLSYDTDDHGLRQAFEKYGSVDSVNIILTNLVADPKDLAS